MMPRWRWLLTLFARKLWLRVTLIALMGVGTAAAGVIFAPYVPEEWTLKIGAQAIDGILNVLASSMLAVTVFSLSTMVSAYSAATTNVTPRATRLLMEDNKSQNVLGTFIGAFLFSLVGIIALSTGLYGSQGRAILLVVTIGLVTLIAATILRWIDYLTRFGRLSETIERVERATWGAMRTRIEHPHLGAQPLETYDGGVPAAAWPAFAPTAGYVQHIDVVALEECAKEIGAEIFLTALPGAFADPARPIAMILGPEKEEFRTVVGEAFTIGAERLFDQDPRFGLCVLGEIASRALSPAVNDPGTAIDVIGRVVRLLVQWARAEQTDDAEEVECPHVYAPAMEVCDMFDDIFGPIARDGAGLVEVQIRLQKAYLALLATDAALFGAAARAHATTALLRSEAGLQLEEEKQIIRTMAQAVLRADVHI